MRELYNRAMKYTSKKIGFFQATGLLVYIFLIAEFFRLAPILFGGTIFVAFVSIILFLLLFVISALISGALILGYPVVLFFEGKKIEAIKTILWSLVWLFILFIIIGIIAILPSIL